MINRLPNEFVRPKPVSERSQHDDGLHNDDFNGGDSVTVRAGWFAGQVPLVSLGVAFAIGVCLGWALKRR